MLTSGRPRFSRAVGVLAAAIAVSSGVIVEAAHLEVEPLLLYGIGYVGLALLGWGFHRVEGFDSVVSRRRMTLLAIGYAGAAIVMFPLTLIIGMPVPHAPVPSTMGLVVYGAAGGLPLGLAAAQLAS